MLYLTQRPPAALTNYVEYLWLLSDAPRHARERILPSGTLELVANLREDEIRIYNDMETERCSRFSGVVVSGAYSRFFIIDTAEHALTMGVHFRPGGATPFLGLPASELKDRHVDLGSLWGAAASRLRERLCAARNHAQRFGVLGDALCDALRSARQHAAVRFALRALQRPDARVQELARNAGLSHRRLIELFDAEVGMTPKVFLRVIRFQRVREALASATQDAVQLALECGYFDQSHLIRDFQAFTGLTPTRYRLRLAADRVKENHVALD